MTVPVPPAPRGGAAREIELTAEVFGHEPGRYRARTREFDRAARVRRAARVFGLLLAGALISLPIPAWHLIGVPGFLIAAIVMGVRRLREERVVESAVGLCPACGDASNLDLPDTVRFPHTLPCPRCGEYVRLSQG
jgi:hypothetical protein